MELQSETKFSKSKQNNRWLPYALRPAFLISLILCTLGLIVVLLLLLRKSERDQGLIFAAEINALPVVQTIPYLYLPTIIAVIYSFLWTWVDLDVRRTEPFFQLAKDGGASGEQSLLLAYPVDFIASVPFKALRFRHWSPFVASLATVLVFWGVTPFQAGIFAVSNVNIISKVPVARVADFVSNPLGASVLSASAAQSVSSILWLNETLQPFMTRDMMLAPFNSTSITLSNGGSLSAVTKRYSVNVTCEPPTIYLNNDVAYLNSTWGCNYRAPPPRTGPGLKAADNKTFDGLYVGFWNLGGNADYYLSSGGCPKTANQSFLIQWSRLKVASSIYRNLTSDNTRDYADVNSLWCRSEYFMQEGEASIDVASQRVLSWHSTGPSQPLPQSMFNATLFENAINAGRVLTGNEPDAGEAVRFRTDFPTTEWPDQTAYLENTTLNLGYIHKMVPYAIGISKLAMDAYLEEDRLAESFQAAYRLLFARYMSDTFARTFEPDMDAEALWQYETQAVVMDPTFTYVVLGLLGIACLSSMFLLGHAMRRKTELISDPSTIAATMSLAASDRTVLREFSGYDRATTEELQRDFSDKTFQLQAASVDDSRPLLRFSNSDLLLQHSASQSTETSKKKSSTWRSDDAIPGVLPTELSLKVGSAFLGVQVILAVGIATLYALIKSGNGLPLPSSDRFVRQLLENYVLTAVGTMIEPFWVVLNRTLCSLQPFEALRKGQRKEKDSLELEYSSLPPQLVFGKAFGARDYFLATVCAMTLLANVLSVSLSGLLLENNVRLPVTASFTQTLRPVFASLNGSATPLSETSMGTVEPFFIANSNRTAKSPLPAWVDRNFFYLPFLPASPTENTSSYQAETLAIGAELQCHPLSAESTFTLTGTDFDNANLSSVLSSSSLLVKVSLPEQDITCEPRNTTQAARAGSNTIFERPTGPSAYEFAYALQGLNGSSSTENSLCMEHVAAGWVHAVLINGEKKRTDDSATPSIVQSYEPMIIICRSQIVTGRSDVTVAATGYVQGADMKEKVAATQDQFTSSQADVLGQAHQFIINRGMTWHNDTNPSDWPNYLISKDLNSSRLLDPRQPLPTFDEVVEPFSKVYSELFAIWLGTKSNELLVDGVASAVEGRTLHSETRIFMSLTMFIITETILVLYIVVTGVLYVRRPWKFLCRLPTDLASIIAFFAASRAVDDFRDTSGMTRKHRRQHIGTDNRYGFGTFVGRDAGNHLGIEKHPYVAKLTKNATYTTGTNYAEPSRIRRWQSRLRQWKSGKVMEGGRL